MKASLPLRFCFKLYIFCMCVAFYPIGWNKILTHFCGIELDEEMNKVLIFGWFAVVVGELGGILSDCLEFFETKSEHFNQK